MVLKPLLVIGTCLADELTKSGFNTINEHQTIYVLEPEYNANSQIVFRDNNVGMIRGKHVMVLMASVTTGYTAKRSLEAIGYYGGHVAGVAAIYSAVEEVGGYPVVTEAIRTITCLPRIIPTLLSRKTIWELALYSGSST